MMKKEDVMELIDMTKLTNMINGLKDKEIVVKEKHTINWKKVACVVGVIAAVAGVAYAIYRYFKTMKMNSWMILMIGMTMKIFLKMMQKKM